MHHRILKIIAQQKLQQCLEMDSILVLPISKVIITATTILRNISFRPEWHECLEMDTIGIHHNCLSIPSDAQPGNRQCLSLETLEAKGSHQDEDFCMASTHTRQHFDTTGFDNKRVYGDCGLHLVWEY